MLRPSLLAVALLALVACGSESPTRPSAVPAPPSSIAVTVPPLVYIGAQAQATATAAGTWSVEPSTLATITSAGQLTGRASGRGTVTLTHTNGTAGSAPLRVLPNYAGSFRGRWRITSCAESGELRGCAEVFRVEDGYAMTASVTQADDVATVTIDLLPVRSEPTTQTIRDDGSLPVQTVAFYQTGKAEIAGTLQSTQAGRITGSGPFSLRWTEAGFSGDIRVTFEIENLDRVS